MVYLSQAQDSWKAIGATGFSTRTLAVLHGTHSIYHSNPTVTFYAMMYGQVEFESYGFPAGGYLTTKREIHSVTSADKIDLKVVGNAKGSSKSPHVVL